jgi:NAD(P)-dependent dehydrogenase (short-subunit alcohol dehydrogenase family)
MNLCNQVVLVAGGIGTIGRGISRGLLRAGANVVVYSRSDAKLDQLVSELSTSDTTHGRLIGMNGTMSTPEGARALHQDLTNMTGGALHHVVAHAGVRSWKTRNAIECDSVRSSHRQTSVLELSHEEFQHESHALVEMTWNCASEFLRNGGLRNQPGASFTIVSGNGGASPLAKLNSHAVHGLAAALRCDTKDDAIRVNELRVQLVADRTAKERALEPRSRPLSADIGEIVAGIAARAATEAGSSPTEGELIEIPNMEELAGLRQQFETEEIVPQPLLWNWQQQAA